jgi:hypothetical protein
MINHLVFASEALFALAMTVGLHAVISIGEGALVNGLNMPFEISFANESNVFVCAILVET